MTEDTGTQHWTCQIDDDGIAWLGLDKQGTGTNVLSSDVMAGLHERLGEIEQAAP